MLLSRRWKLGIVHSNFSPAYIFSPQLIVITVNIYWKVNGVDDTFVVVSTLGLSEVQRVSSTSNWRRRYWNVCRIAFVYSAFVLIKCSFYLKKKNWNLILISVLLTSLFFRLTCGKLRHNPAYIFSYYLSAFFYIRKKVNFVDNIFFIISSFELLEQQYCASFLFFSFC